MTANMIGCQCRRVILLRSYFTVRDKSEFDESLETVANSKGQTVSLIQKLIDRFFDPLIAEYGSNEFGGAIRFITGAEARPGTSESEIH